MNNQTKLPVEKPKGYWIPGVLWMAVIGAIFLYSAWSYWFGEKPVSNCKDATREVQTIRKIDGDVDSVETEIVSGCEYPNGDFIPAPGY